MTWQLMVHGGCGAMRPGGLNPDQEEAARLGLNAALDVGAVAHHRTVFGVVDVLAHDEPAVFHRQMEHLAVAHSRRRM